jgi:hypothetical protein
MLAYRDSPAPSAQKAHIWHFRWTVETLSWLFDPTAPESTASLQVASMVVSMAQTNDE